MAGELWWVPSLIVLAAVAAGVLVLVSVLRRRTRERVETEKASAAELARTAAINLVRADDLVQSATDELSFAIAQFGENATHEFATALATSRRQLRGRPRHVHWPAEQRVGGIGSRRRRPVPPSSAPVGCRSPSRSPG